MGQIISCIWRWLGGREKNRSKKRDNEILKQQETEATKAEHSFSIHINESPPLSTTATTTTSSSSNFRQTTNDHNVSITPTTHANWSNQRAEKTTSTCRTIGDYNSSQRILLVGEGDFSFSASLARAFGSASNIISTSLDSFEFLERNYRRSMKNVAELKGRGCMVLHEINATEIANHAVLGSIKFDRIIFNFPLAGFFGQHVPRDLQIGMNQVLVYLFMGNAKKMITEDGEIHITHKSYGFFRQWNLQQLGHSQSLWLTEEVNFDRTHYPGYHTKYGFGGDKNFDCHNSKTYKFRLMLT